MKTSLLHISPQPAGVESARKAAGLSTTDEALLESFGPLRERIELTTIIPEEDGFEAQRQSIDEAKGVVITGGGPSLLDPTYTAQVFVREMFRVAEHFMTQGKPVLAICLGHQIINAIAGGMLEKARDGGEYGRFSVELTEAGVRDQVFNKVPEVHPIFQAHSDTVQKPCSDAVVLANSERCPFQALRYPDSKIVTLQGHPEWPPKEGRKIIRHSQPEFREEAPKDSSQDNLAKVVGRMIIRNWLKYFS